MPKVLVRRRRAPCSERRSHGAAGECVLPWSGARDGRARAGLVSGWKCAPRAAYCFRADDPVRFVSPTFQINGPLRLFCPHNAPRPSRIPPACVPPRSLVGESSATMDVSAGRAGRCRNDHQPLGTTRKSRGESAHRWPTKLGRRSRLERSDRREEATQTHGSSCNS